MTTKQYLGQISRLDRMIQNKLSEIYQLKTLACSVTVSSDKERVQTSGDKDRVGGIVAKIYDLERETDALVDKFVDEKKKIIAQIDSIEDENMYHVLSSRYVLRKTFGEIAIEMAYSRTQVDRIHEKALNEFEKRYGEGYMDKK